MIKKNIIATLSVMTALSSFSFAEQAVPIQVPAKQTQKTISAEKVDWKKVENLTKKKADLKAQKELLGYQMRAEMKDNNLRAGHTGKNLHRGSRPAPQRG